MSKIKLLNLLGDISSKKIIYLALKYFSYIGGMATYMVATINLESQGQNILFIYAVSFTLGIACGDTNTLTFYQTILKEKGEFDNGYYLFPRLILSLGTSLIVSFLFTDLVLYYFYIGVLISFIFPQGRISSAAKFGSVVIFGGILKIVISLYIILEKIYIIPIEYLVCMAISSNYIASAPFHLFAKNLFQYDLKKLSFTKSFKILLRSFILTIPIQFYTSLAPFFYMQVKGANDIATYYLYERLIRGLGATVMGIQSGTTSQVSLLLSSLNKKETLKIFTNYLIYYFIIGFSIGILFIIITPFIFNILKIEISVFDNKFIWIFTLTTASMYVSNYIGIQILMTMGKIGYITSSSIFAAIIFILSLLLFDEQLLVIAASEIAIALFQIGVFYKYIMKNKLIHTK
jgi:hypothetical protein